MGLIWSERCVARNWDGKDTHGAVYAQVIGFTNKWGACINEIGCGHPRGMWIHDNPDAFTTPQAAMDAADRHVAAYLDSLRAGGVELRHGDTPP